MAIKGTPHKLVQETGDLVVEAWMIGPMFYGEYRSYYRASGLKHCHTFYDAHHIHGQYVQFHQEGGALQCIYFYVSNKVHGDSYVFDERGNLVKQFWMNNEKHDAPFLPKKPKRLPYTSGRSRVDTLEI